MDMSGERHIAASKQVVWDALNDPEVLKQSIPGAQEVIKTSDNEFQAKVAQKIGPISARFSGVVTLSDIDPPNSYTLSGQGQGGAAGFAKGSASVKLDEATDGGTDLKYEVKASVGGKMAQLGARLIDGTAAKLADEFFDNFKAAVESAGKPAAPAEPAAPPVTPEPAPQPEAPAAAAEPEQPTPPPSAEQQPVQSPREPERPRQAEEKLYQPAAAPAAPRQTSDRHAPQPVPGGVPQWIWYVAAGLVLLVAIVLLSG
ncbi:MAG: carbon monoxide dehydrogenase subunit G [Acetobacterales bacterium]